MKVLKEFKVSSDFQLDYDQLKEAKGIINLHYLGDTVCNHVVDGKMVAKYPEKETKELEDAHCNLYRSHEIEVTVQLMEDGTIRLKP